MREDDWQYFHDPEFVQLLKEYEEAQDQGRRLYLDADELTDIAEYYMLNHEEKKADAAIRLATELHPESVDPQVFLARQQMFHDNIDEAFRICDAIVDQQDQEVAFLKAELYLRQDKANEASQLFHDTFKNITEERDLFLYDAAGLFLDYAQWEQAKEWAELLVRQFPDSQKGQYLMADVHFSMGENEQAIETLNKLLDRNPYHTEAWNLLAEAQLANEQYQEALESTEYVLAIQSDNRQALINKAHSLFHLDQPEEAHNIYRQLIQTDSHDETLYYFDSLCLSNLERFEEAAEAIRQAEVEARDMSVEQFNIYLQKAYVESKLHNLDNAISALKQARDAQTPDVPFEFHLLLGQIYLENGEDEEAEEAFVQAFSESKDQCKTLLLIGIAFGETMHYEQSAQILKALLDNFGTDEGHEAIPYLAYCHYQLQNHNEFLHYLRLATAANRETTQYLFSPVYPNIQPEEYYNYAFHALYGRFPEKDE